MPKTKDQIPKAKYPILFPNPKSQVPNPRYQIPNTQYQIPNANS